MSVSSLHMHPVCGLNPFLSFWMSIGKYGYNCKSTFMPFCIVEHSIRSPTDRFLVEICGDLATDSSINSHCHPLVGRLPVLGLYCMLRVVKSLCFNRSSACFEGFLAGSFLEIVTQLVHSLPCLWTFVCWVTDNSSIMNRTPTHALYVQHYIILTCWFH